jgi:hypothetical protein
VALLVHLVAFHQVSTGIGELVGVGPEIGNAGDPAVVGEQRAERVPVPDLGRKVACG